MRATIAALLLTAFLPSCMQRDAEVARLRAEVAENERMLRNARAEAVDNANVAAARADLLEKEKARADVAEEKLERMRVLLEAQRSTAPQAGAPVASPPVTRASAATQPSAASAWQELERQQRDREAAWRRKLESTTVYVNNADGGGSYHVYGCERLYVTEFYRDGTAWRRYAGSSITLAAAHDRRLSRDSGCGPPSYDFRYND